MKKRHKEAPTKHRGKVLLIGLCLLFCGCRLFLGNGVSDSPDQRDAAQQQTSTQAGQLSAAEETGATAPVTATQDVVKALTPEQERFRAYCRQYGDSTEEQLDAFMPICAVTKLDSPPAGSVDAAFHLLAQAQQHAEYSSETLLQQGGETTGERRSVAEENMTLMEVKLDSGDGPELTYYFRKKDGEDWHLGRFCYGEDVIFDYDDNGVPESVADNSDRLLEGGLSVDFRNNGTIAFITIILDADQPSYISTHYILVFFSEANDPADSFEVRVNLVRPES